MSVRSVAFFDFDETLISVDSFPLFIRFSLLTSIRAWIALPQILFWSLAFRFRLCKGGKAKQRILSSLCKGRTASQWQKINENFAEILHKYDEPALIFQLKEHSQRGDEVVIVTASPTDRVQAWAKLYPEIDLIIGTDMEFVGEKLSGKFATPNCIAQEKVKRMRESYPNLDDLDTFGYGDSLHDRYFLSEVKHPHYNDWKRK